MKKALFALALVPVAALIAAPKFIAPQHQDALSDIVANINNAPGYSAELVATQTRWFGSNNTLLLTLDMAQFGYPTQEDALQLELELDSQFGPILFADQGVFGLFNTQISVAAPTLRNALSWDETQDFYRLSILGDTSGNLKLMDVIPELRSLDNELTFRGYSGQGEITSDTIRYQGVAEDTQLSNGYTTIKAEDFGVSIDLDAGIETLLQGGFYGSEMTFTLNALEVNDRTKLSGLKVALSTAFDQKTALGNIGIGYFADAVTHQDITVSDLAVVTELNRLSNRFFLDYKAFAENMLAQNTLNHDLYDPLLIFLQENIDTLLSENPEFNITEIRATFPQGRVSASVTSAIVGMENPTLNALLTPEYWLYHTVAKANIKVDAALLNNLVERFIANQTGASASAPHVKERARMMIQPFVQQGFIRFVDGQAETQAVLENGQVDVYGTVFPLM